MMNKDDVARVLRDNGIEIEDPVRYKTCGWRIKLKSGPSLYVYDKGNFYYQGSEKDGIGDRVRKTVEEEVADEPNNRVFVAYGHDAESKNLLEDILVKHGLEPLFLDALPSGGKTIIEKLEAYIPRANYGVVLMTPDDCAFMKDDPTKTKLRARQNVVLELGMLLMKLGRSKVAILSKVVPDFELPSDIDGVMRLQYSDNVAEVEEKLLKELATQGYGELGL